MLAYALAMSPNALFDLLDAINARLDEICPGIGEEAREALVARLLMGDLLIITDETSKKQT